MLYKWLAYNMHILFCVNQILSTIIVTNKILETFYPHMRHILNYIIHLFCSSDHITNIPKGDTKESGYLVNNIEYYENLNYMPLSENIKSGIRFRFRFISVYLKLKGAFWANCTIFIKGNKSISVWKKRRICNICG